MRPFARSRRSCALADDLDSLERTSRNMAALSPSIRRSGGRLGLPSTARISSCRWRSSSAISPPPSTEPCRAPIRRISSMPSPERRRHQQEQLIGWIGGVQQLVVRPFDQPPDSSTADITGRFHQHDGNPATMPSLVGFKGLAVPAVLRLSPPLTSGKRPITSTASTSFAASMKATTPPIPRVTPSTSSASPSRSSPANAPSAASVPKSP